MGIYQKSRDDRIATVKYNSFKGFNDTLSQDKLSQQDCTYIENFRISDKGTLQRRAGSTQMGTVDYFFNTWTHFYDCSILPDGVGGDGWTASSPFTITASLIGPSPLSLRLLATSGQVGSYVRTETSYSNATGVSVKLRLKTVSGAGYFFITIEDGTKKSTVYVYFNAPQVQHISATTTKTYTYSTTEVAQLYNEILIQQQLNTVRIYVNGICRIIDTPLTTTSNKQITFGVTTVAPATFDVYLDYLYSNAGLKYAADYIRALVHFKTNTGINEIVAQSGEALFKSYDNGTSWTFLYGRLSMNYKVTFAIYLDKLYICNGYNTMLWYDGITITRADDESGATYFPKGKFVAVDENGDVMAVAGLRDSPNALMLSSITDGSGGIVAPYQSAAWQYATTVEMEDGGDIIGIIHYLDYWVICQRHKIVLIEGFNPNNYRKYELRFNTTEGSGLVAHETLQIKDGVLYGMGESKMWRWTGQGNLEDLSTNRIETVYATVYKPERKHFMTTTKAQWDGCTKANCDTYTVSGDVSPYRARLGTVVYGDSYGGTTIWTGTQYINDEDLGTDHADAILTSTGTAYIGIRLNPPSADYAIQYINSVRIKYKIDVGLTAKLQHSADGSAWYDTSSGTLTCDWTLRTETFTFTSVNSRWIRILVTNTAGSLNVEIYGIWFPTATITGVGRYIGESTEMGVFEADTCTGASSATADTTISYYVRYATTLAGLTGDWIQVFVGELLPSRGTNEWIQWRAEMAMPDNPTSVSWNFTPTLGGYPILHFVNICFMKGGYFVGQPVAIENKNNYYLACSVTASTRNDIILIYDKNNQWLYDTGKYVGSLLVKDGVLYHGWGYSTDMYGRYFVKEDPTVRKDIGMLAPCNWYSRYEDFGDYATQKNLRRGRIEAKFGSVLGSVKVTSYRISRTIGTTTNVETTPTETTITNTNSASLLSYEPFWLPTGYRGNLFQFRVTHNTVDEIFEMSLLQIEARMANLI